MLVELIQETTALINNHTVDREVALLYMVGESRLPEDSKEIERIRGIM
jgi:hypothetical protein